MKPKPTRSAAPSLLPNRQPDRSNVICLEETSRQIAAAIAWWAWASPPSLAAEVVHSRMG